MVTAEPLVISPAGEFDIYSQPRFAELLQAGDEEPCVVLDFGRVRYIDATCMSELIGMHKRRLIAGRRPAHIAAINPSLRHVFSIARLDRVWPMFDTVKDACNAFDLPTHVSV